MKFHQLLQKGASPNYISKSRDDYTGLMHALLKGNTEIVSILLEVGADPNIQDNFGYYPLMGAIYPPPSIEVINILLEAGADPNIKDKEGRTAIDMAEDYGDEEVIKLLKQY